MFIVLFEESREEITISITAEIKSNGDFSLKGNDSGELVKKLKGDWNYEYNLFVKKKDKAEFIRKLSLGDPLIKSDADFMEWLKSNYSHHDTYSRIRNLLNKHNISYDSFLWP